MARNDSLPFPSRGVYQFDIFPVETPLPCPSPLFDRLIKGSESEIKVPKVKKPSHPSVR